MCVHLQKRNTRSKREDSTRGCLISFPSAYTFTAKKKCSPCIWQKNFSTASLSNLHSTVSAIFLLALITVSRQITSGSASPAEVSSSWPFFFLSLGKCFWKRGDFQQRNDAPRPFPFPDDSRRGEGVTGEEGNEGASRGSGVGTQRGAVFFFTRSIAGISHKSREKPGAFEPLSFIVSTTSPSHDSNLPLLLALPLHLPLPLPTTRSLPQAVAFAPLSMALRLTTNFSSRPTFLHPRVLVYGAKLASSRSLRGYHFFVARGWRDREVQWLAPQSQLTVIIKRLRFIIKRLEKILNEKKWRERVVRCLSWTFVCRAIFISQKKKKNG